MWLANHVTSTTKSSVLFDSSSFIYIYSNGTPLSSKHHPHLRYLSKITDQQSPKSSLVLVDPGLLGGLPGLDLLWLEPESNLLLGVLDRVGAVADVASDIDGVVTTDGAWGGGQWVGGTEENAAGLDGVLALPDHGADWARVHVWCVLVAVELRGSERSVQLTRPAKNPLLERSS